MADVRQKKSDKKSNGRADRVKKRKLDLTNEPLGRGGGYGGNGSDDRFLVVANNGGHRLDGDGEAFPETPLNEEVAASDHDGDGAGTDHPFSIEITVDGVAVILLLLGLSTRMFRLDQPRNVVFDEMHYGKYASMYLKRTFFFDANPPLGKMLVAVAGWAVGYGGDFGFDKIGTPYPEDVPIASLRFVPALFGSLLTPTLYLIVCELGMSTWTGVLAGILVLLDTAFLAQSRFVLMESIMMFFSFAAVLSVLKVRRRPFGRLGWWFWTLSASVNMGLALSVKYLAFYSCAFCVALFLRDFWQRRVSDRNLTNLQLLLELISQFSVLCLVPVSVYLTTFYLHFEILTRAGAHDSLMTSAFQASLDGGLSSIIKGQPLTVAHGSQITLRHTHGRTCWLHSHEHVYPVRYPDGRGSSHQQQVSCYGYKDVNNWWIVKRPEREDLAVHEPLDPVKHGEVIQLVHGMTHRALNSHDVAAPMSAHNQEVTCYIDYNISMSAENLWRVEIVNGGEADDAKGNVWHSINSQVRLVHLSTEQALKYSGKVYADWGFYQNEVVCDKQANQMDAVWNVEEHRYTKSDEDKKSIEKEIVGAEMIPEAPTKLSFKEKFLELQLKMLITNQENVQNHNYASDPLEWLFLTRGIAYFVAKDSNAQIHLLGNIVIWYSGTVLAFVYAVLLLFYLVRRRRRCFDMTEGRWRQFVGTGEVLLGGYLFHFLPFFFCDRTLFLHHYLPAYGFKIMLSAFVVNHLYRQLLSSGGGSCRFPWMSRAGFCLVLLWLGAVCHVFQLYSVLSYGFHPLSADDVRSLRWKDSWDLIIHKA